MQILQIQHLSPENEFVDSVVFFIQCWYYCVLELREILRFLDFNVLQKEAFATLFLLG